MKTMNEHFDELLIELKGRKISTIATPTEDIYLRIIAATRQEVIALKDKIKKLEDAFYSNKHPHPEINQRS